MTLNLPAGAMTDAATISPLALFLQADIVVKGVMIGLLLASIWTWAMIIGFSVTLRNSGVVADNYTITPTLPAGWSGSWPANASDIEMRMQQGFSVFVMGWGESGFATVDLGRRVAGR